jgi:hypothetical protein
MVFFQDRVSRTICRGWLLISASWVGRITGVSHQCPALLYFSDRVLSFCLDHDPSTYMASCITEITGAHYCARFIDWDEDFSFCLGWSSSRSFWSLNSWNYRCEPLCLAYTIYFFKLLLAVFYCRATIIELGIKSHSLGLMVLLKW